MYTFLLVSFCSWTLSHACTWAWSRLLYTWHSDFAYKHWGGRWAGPVNTCMVAFTYTLSLSITVLYYYSINVVKRLLHFDIFTVSGELNVYACNKRLVWTKSGNLGDVWYKATFRFECSGEFHVSFQTVIFFQTIYGRVSTKILTHIIIQDFLRQI